MKKISLPETVCQEFERMASEKKIYLEGNILKVLEFPEYPGFASYIKEAKDNDSQNRRKRLEVTKQVQEQNKQLHQKRIDNEKLMEELKEALKTAENAKKSAEEDLDLIQKKTQFELIGNIVQVALWVIIGVGVIVTAMYWYAIYANSSETTLIGNAWSNLFGILLTNSFSIIGTIMGVKYASDSKKEK